MLVALRNVSIPAMSTIGYGIGIDIETGERVRFAGDHRAMRAVGEAMAFSEREDEDVLVEVEDWQVLSRGLAE